MKKYLIPLCFVLAVIIILGLKFSTGKIADKNIDASGADITDLFLNVQDIESIVTMRVDTLYTLDTRNKIDKLMKLLGDIDYKEYHNGSKRQVLSEIEITGSRTNGIDLVFYYQDGSRRTLEFLSEEEGEFVEYSEITYDPYEIKSSKYTTKMQEWHEVWKIMSTGSVKDLNKQQ